MGLEDAVVQAIVKRDELATPLLQQEEHMAAAAPPVTKPYGTAQDKWNRLEARRGPADLSNEGFS